jgi:N-acetylglucosamine kinase-like BadF-type ATPase
LATLVSTIARRLDMANSNVEVYCTGGVFKAGPILLNPFRKELRRNVPRFVLRRPKFDPVIGAFVLALKEYDVAMLGGTLGNLRSSYARLALKIR